jgi:hypothetical protein
MIILKKTEKFFNAFYAMGYSDKQSRVYHAMDLTDIYVRNAGIDIILEYTVVYKNSEY